MCKNLIPFIAERLGVSIGKEFRIEAVEGTYRFNNNALQRKVDFLDSWSSEALQTVLWLLVTGQRKIQRNNRKGL